MRIVLFMMPAGHDHCGLSRKSINAMNRHLTIIGAPSSAGAYGPGQEKAPDALREAGLIQYLQENNIAVTDKKNVTGFRWKVDKEQPRAMNTAAVAKVAREVALQVADAISRHEKVLVLGGDCTIELGSVAGCLQHSGNIGLLYIDLDADLNTPQSVEDGALDWMGVAHLLNIDGTEPLLNSLAKKQPMLTPHQVHLFGTGNTTNFEREIIKERNILQTPVEDVIRDPSGTAKDVLQNWAPSFEHLLIHLDVDVLDYIDLPIAENYRRNQGLKFEQLLQSLEVFLKAPNWSVLTITEINPDHGEENGETLREFARKLAFVLSEAFAH